MSAPHERAATLEAFGAPVTRATAVLVSQNPGQRLVRAIAILVGCWAAAIASVFIPVAHFFLVPGFVVLGVALAVYRGRERERLLGVHGVCPRCGREQELGRGERQGGQTWVTCPACFTRLLVTIGARGPSGASSAAPPPAPAATVR
jgi:hypothetical protein